MLFASSFEQGVYMLQIGVVLASVVVYGVKWVKSGLISN
jgi:hypothetical protein